MCLAPALAMATVCMRPSKAFADELPPKRPVPDYDGRGPEPITEGDVLIWVPRVLFAPVWLVSEYLLRWPLGALTTALDKVGLQDFITAESDYLLFPTLVVDFGFRSSIGLYSGINNLWFEGHQVRLRGAFGGIGFYKVKLKDRVVFDDGTQRIGVFGAFRQRADDQFAGIGSDIAYDRDAAGRYTGRTLEAAAQYDLGLDRLTGLTVRSGVRDVLNDPTTCCDDPSLADQIARGEVESPPGFDQRFTTWHSELRGGLDSRRALDDRDPWGRVEAIIDADVSGDPTQLSWLLYGGEVGGGFELGLPRRRLTWSTAALFADPLGADEIPFTSLVSLGGSRYMRGFGTGSLLGRSALVSTLKYNWPIWVYLDGSLHVALGNVFDEHLESFAMEKMRLSFGPGISTNFIDEDSVFDMSFAVGTETFEQGTEIASVRFALGITDGF
jgi:hypothetical protein